MSHGGARAGSGRKPIKGTRLGIKFTPEELETLDEFCVLFEIEGAAGPRALNRTEAMRRLVNVNAARAIRARKKSKK